ncbi:hypothetical protein C8R43DRAFT_1242178 [Mycena crocata]|nr:hypothetical protein C8R43DRAFT_1242178 [Mycena crocata]
MASPPGLPPIPAEIATIAGPSLLGICFNWGFMGVLVVQLYFYYINFPHDTKGIKALVSGLAILDIVQTVLVTADAFHWFAFGFGNMERLDDTFLSSWDVPMLDSLISLIVQIFYCWRIYVLRKSLVFPVIITVAAATQAAFGILTAVKSNELGKLSLIGSTEAKVAFQTTWLVGSAVVDVTIAVVITWTLLRARNKGFISSHSLINRIVQMTVETNALTGGVAVTAVVIYLTVPQHSTYVVPPAAIMGKLYSNCLVAILNNRNIIASAAAVATPMGTTAAVSNNLPTFRVPNTNVHVVEHMDLPPMEMSDFGKETYGSQFQV